MLDTLTFTRELLRAPRQTMALAPSSVRLCREMARQALLAGAASGPVIELGGGTGKITEALLAAGVAPAQLHVIEVNPAFVSLLRSRFPGVTVRHARAEEITAIGVEGAAAVVSGLPLLSMPAPVQEAIVGGAFEVLRPEGAFVQFTYGTVPPVRSSLRTQLGLQHHRSQRILWNLPPARVYRFTKPS